MLRFYFNDIFIALTQIVSLQQRLCLPSHTAACTAEIYFSHIILDLLHIAIHIQKLAVTRGLHTVLLLIMTVTSKTSSIKYKIFY